MDWKFYYDQLKGVDLELVSAAPGIQIFHLTKYSGRAAMSIEITFTQRGIDIVAIVGDNEVAGNGMFAKGHDIEWFARKLEPEYLAEKFLKKRWVPEKAFEFWMQQLRVWETFSKNTNNHHPWLQPQTWMVCGNRLEEATIITALAEMVDHSGGFPTPESVVEGWPLREDERMPHHFYPVFTEDMLTKGHGYAEEEIGWLSAIQRRFAELYPPVTLRMD